MPHNDPSKRPAQSSETPAARAAHVAQRHKYINQLASLGDMSRPLAHPKKGASARRTKHLGFQPSETPMVSRKEEIYEAAAGAGSSAGLASSSAGLAASPSSFLASPEAAPSPSALSDEVQRVRLSRSSCMMRVLSR